MLRRSLVMLVLVAVVSVFALPLSAAPPHKQTGPGGGFSDEGTWTSQNCLDESTSEIVGSVGAGGPEKLWPPNHKFPRDPNTVVATASDSGDGVNLMLTMVSPLDATGGDGGSNHDPDASPIEDSHNDPVGDQSDSDASSDAAVDPAGFDQGESGDPDGEGTSTTEHGLRAERSGKGTGRIYQIDWMVIFTDDGDGTYGTAECDSAIDATDEYEPFYVCVPHDMRPSNRGAECEGPVT